MNTAPTFLSSEHKFKFKEVMLISNKTDKTQDNCIIRCIGSTNYKVRVFFSETEKETMEDKILRMIQNEVSTSREICDTLKVSQMSCPA